MDDLRKAIDWALYGRCDLLLGIRLVAAGLPLWQTLSLDLEIARNCEAALAEMDGIGCEDPSLELNLAVGLAAANTLLSDDTGKTIAMFQRAIDLARAASDANAEFRALGALALYAVLPGTQSDPAGILEAMGIAAVRTNDPFALWEQQHALWLLGELRRLHLVISCALRKYLPRWMIIPNISHQITVQYENNDADGFRCHCMVCRKNRTGTKTCK